MRHSFQLDREADCIESAVSVVLNDGLRTADLATGGQKPTPTSEMGQQVVEAIKKVAKDTKPKSA
jgi:3-isopropylmalate dehydrogenase